ncbi:LTA synthase family protein [[Clostridium] dakarense]|uniref:LTA synthase family protein n=1 Tax=Faecalimicrobium dakarense TaxID=1301100 RepID=UPI0004AFB86F|nr:sulfatase-like hydrolase/transferase [[Clostridium] dakarense]
MDNKLISKFKINKSSIVELISWLVGGTLLFLISEFLQRESIVDVITFFKDRTNAFFINYLIILILTSVIFILKRKKTGYLIISTIVILLSIINKVMLEIRGMPITYSDIFSIKDGLSIANKYINMKMVILVSICLLIVIGTIIYVFKKEKKSKRITSYTNILIALLLVGVYSVRLDNLKERKVISPLRWDLKESYRHNGFMYSLLDSYFGYKREKPKDYDKASVEDIKNEVNSVQASNINSSSKKENKPNIIFVQLESFMDPTLIKEAKFSEDPIPNFRKLSNENKSGYINVPVIGGGTARTEFEVLTGNNFDYLIPGEIPYDSFVKKKNVNSIATTLKNQGYGAHIMHNFQGNFYNRNLAFKNLGFDTFTSMEYMQNLEDTHLGWRKDIVLADYIEKALNKTKESDVVYAIGVEGHGGYPDYDRGEEFPIKVETNLPDKDMYQLYNYANLLKGSDDLVGKVIENVDKREEDTIVVFFSDHLPKLNIFSGDNMYIDKYEVPYAIYSNFKIDNEKQNLEAYQLSTLMLGLAGVEYGPMESLHAKDGGKENYQEQLELVQYDMLFGKQFYLSDKDKYKGSSMKMGLDDIVVEKVIKDKDTMIVKGKNFTSCSYVYVDGKKVETTWIDENTLKIGNIDKGKSLEVKQLGKYDGVLSSSNKININK